MAPKQFIQVNNISELALLLSTEMQLSFKNGYKVSVLTICWLRVGRVARGWQLHVPTLLLLHIHVIIWVLHKGSRPRGHFGRQIAGTIPLVADSAIHDLYLISTANKIMTQNIFFHSCIK